MTAIYKREMRSYFTSPVGYIFVAIFLAVSAFFFMDSTVQAGDSSSVSSYFMYILYIFIIIIPLIFLALLFFTGSSKVIFLILWIVSLFILAAYLITVEYMDYNLMERMAKLRGQDEDMENYDLIGNDAIENRIRDVLDKIDGTEAGHEEHN